MLAVLSFYFETGGGIVNWLMYKMQQWMAFGGCHDFTIKMLNIPNRVEHFGTERGGGAFGAVQRIYDGVSPCGLLQARAKCTCVTRYHNGTFECDVDMIRAIILNLWLGIWPVNNGSSEEQSAGALARCAAAFTHPFIAITLAIVSFVTPQRLVSLCSPLTCKKIKKSN